MFHRAAHSKASQQRITSICTEAVHKKIFWGLPSLSLTTKGLLLYLGGGGRQTSSALWRQYPRMQQQRRRRKIYSPQQSKI